MDLIGTIQANPELIGLPFSAFFILIFIGFTRKGAIAFYAVLCCGFLVPYTDQIIGQGTFEKKLALGFLAPIFLSFILINVAENRKRIASAIVDELLSRFKKK